MKILKRYIKAVIQKGFINNFISKRGQSQIPHTRDRRASLENEQDSSCTKRGTLNVINDGFASGG